MNKRGYILFFILILCISLIKIGYARDIGVSPPRIAINFEPGLKQTFNFKFTGDIGSEYEIFVEGDLSPYIALSKEKIYGPDVVAVHLELPNSIDPPGPHKLQVGIREIPPEGPGIMIVGDVRANLVVFVPYPGKYLETEFSTSDARYGEFSDFNLKVISRGEEDLTASINIEVYDSQDNLVNKMDLGEHFIKSQEIKEFNEKFDTIGFRAGEYKAVAIVSYDGKEVIKEDKFKIGELIIKIVGHSDNFVRGIINRLDIEIESLWNDPIEEVYAEILIPNYNIRFKTPFETVTGFSRTNLTGYFDPTPIDKDVFFGSITVYYADKEMRKLVNFKMKKEVDYGKYLMIGGIILVLILIIILIYVTLLKKEADKDLKKKKRAKRR